MACSSLEEHPLPHALVSEGYTPATMQTGTEAQIDTPQPIANTSPGSLLLFALSFSQQLGTDADTLPTV